MPNTTQHDIEEQVESGETLQTNAARYERIRRLAAIGKLPSSWLQGYGPTELDQAIDVADVS